MDCVNLHLAKLPNEPGSTWAGRHQLLVLSLDVSFLFQREPSAEQLSNWLCLWPRGISIAMQIALGDQWSHAAAVPRCLACPAALLCLHCNVCHCMVASASFSPRKLITELVALPLFAILTPAI